MKETFEVYGVINEETGKLVNDITNPKHKFWEKRGSAETALRKYNPNNYVSSYEHPVYDKAKLRVVTIKCEVEN